MNLTKARRHYSLNQSLMLMVLVCALLPTLTGMGLGYAYYRLRVEQVEMTTVLAARTVLARLEQELAKIEASLKVLASTESLVGGDLVKFHKDARNALPAGVVYNYILTDPSGRQILNTLRPIGASLPQQGTPRQLDRVFSDRVTVLTDFFIGPVTGEPAIAMGVPVMRGDEVVYSLNVGLSPARVAEILNGVRLPDGWLAAVLDGSGTIVARSRDAQRFVGQKAVLEIAATQSGPPEGQLVAMTKDGHPAVNGYSRSSLWGWTVAVGVPKAQLNGELRNFVIYGLLGGATGMGLGLWLALRLARRILKSVQELNRAALDLSEGRPVVLPMVELHEAEAVGHAIRLAAQAMGQVVFDASHDALTGLANRRLFDDATQRQVAQSVRSQDQLALLAIDLDGFKAVNDSLGHEMGDAVLREAANRLRSEIRAGDIAARWGGDEFVVLLAGALRPEALHTAERIVVALGRPYAGVAVQVTASVGVAMFPKDGTTAQSLFEAADAALYAAKRDGKNCVRCDCGGAGHPREQRLQTDFFE